MSYITFSPDSSSAAQSEPSASAEGPGEPSDTLASVPPFVTFHTLILDMSGVSFVDLMGIKALAKVSSRGQQALPALPPLLCSPHSLSWEPSFQEAEGGSSPWRLKAPRNPSFPQTLPGWDILNKAGPDGPGQ